MSFTTVVDGAVAVLIKHADFDANNTNHGDYRVLGHGKDRVAVFSYNNLASRQWSLQRMELIWTINIDLLVPWPGEQSTFEANLATERQKVVDTFLTWPALDAVSGVHSAFIVNGAEAEIQSAETGAYKGQRMLLEVLEIVDPSRSE